MTRVPKGWSLATLGSIGKYINGRGFKKSEWAKSGRPIIRIQNLTGTGSGFNYFDGECETRYEVATGDVLMSWAATLDAFIWRGPSAVLNQHIFRVESLIDPMFHYYLLKFVVQELYRQSHGTGMVHVTRDKFLATQVPIPPSAEQRAIVKEIEKQFTRLDSAFGTLQGGMARFQSFRASVLRQLGVNAPLARLGDLLSEALANGRSVRTREGGFPVLRLTALKGGWIDLTETKEGDWTSGEAARFIVRGGDFLVARGNGSLSLVGRGGMVESDPPGETAYPDTLIRVRVDESICDPRYLRLMWDSVAVRRQIENAARTTAGIYKINQRDLADILIPLPALAHQRQAAVAAEEELSVARALEDDVRKATKRTERLRDAVLSAALSGSLVPA